MANKNDNYYLINGNEVEAKVVYIPYKGTYYKNVKDISDMDIATIELGTSFRSAVNKANPTLKQRMDRQFYIGKHPYVNGIKMFKPVEILQTGAKSEQIVNQFRDIAEERNFNYYHGNKLEPENKEKSIQLAHEIMDTFTIEQKRTLLAPNSILGKNIKVNYVSNKHLFEEQVSGYTQLRNLLICYFYIKTWHNTPRNSKLASMQESIDNICGLFPEEPEKIKRVLEEYKTSLLEAKSSEEITKAQEIYKEKTENDNVQINLYDLFKTDEFAFLNQKKR